MKQSVLIEPYARPIPFTFFQFKLIFNSWAWAARNSASVWTTLALPRANSLRPVANCSSLFPVLTLPVQAGTEPEQFPLPL